MTRTAKPTTLTFKGEARRKPKQKPNLKRKTCTNEQPLPLPPIPPRELTGRQFRNLKKTTAIFKLTPIGGVVAIKKLHHSWALVNHVTCTPHRSTHAHQFCFPLSDDGYKDAKVAFDDWNGSSPPSMDWGYWEADETGFIDDLRKSKVYLKLFGKGN